MLYNFLKNITWNADSTLTESILDGYMAIFEAELRPIEYEPILDIYDNVIGGEFETSKGNDIEVSLQIMPDSYNHEWSAEIIFTTNGKTHGEGHNDPEILSGVFYVVNDIIKSSERNITRVKFNGTEEEVKPDTSNPIFINSIKKLNHMTELLTKTISDNPHPTPHVQDTLISIAKTVSDFSEDLVSALMTTSIVTVYQEMGNPVTEWISMVYDRAIEFLADEEVDIQVMQQIDKLVKSYIKHVNDMYNEIGEVQDIAETEYRNNRGHENKRNRAYKTLTRRYFPNVKVETDGGNVILHLPKKD